MFERFQKYRYIFYQDEIVKWAQFWNNTNVLQYEKRNNKNNTNSPDMPILIICKIKGLTPITWFIFLKEIRYFWMIQTQWNKFVNSQRDIQIQSRRTYSAMN